MPRRSFKGYSAVEPVEFDLESADGARKITVHCRDQVPGAVLVDFMSRADQENPASMARALLEVFEIAVVPDEWPDVKKFLEDPDNSIGLEILAEIAGYLAESYSGRPTPVPAPSPPG